MINSEVIVVGAGPAGLNAALHAANSGCEVLLIDNGNRLGGQYWRHLPKERDSLNYSLHYDFDKAVVLRDAVLSHPRISVKSQTQIWSATVTDESVVLRALSPAELDPTEAVFTTTQLILATGAYDRALPFPGWDIPGVMTPGAAQSLLKGHGVIAGKKMVVAGTGPFLLPVASSLAEQGVEIVELLEAHSPMRWFSRTHLLLANPRKMFEGLRYARSLMRHSVRMGFNYAVIEAHPHGEDSVLAGTLEAVTIARIRPDFTVVSGSERRIECDALAVGWGFTPDTSLAGALGLPQKVGSDGAVVVSVDERQIALTMSEKISLYAAGEITGVGGAALSLHEGAIAGLSSARSLGKISEGQYLTATKRLHRSRLRARKFAQALQDVYVVGDGWRTWLEPSTLICRCEEVSRGQVDHAVEELGARNSRDVKLFSRVGMGMCQGRVCGRNVADYLRTDDVDRIRSTHRPIIAPITLGELAHDPLL